jgi:hypothetical protein
MAYKAHLPSREKGRDGRERKKRGGESGTQRERWKTAEP